MGLLVLATTVLCAVVVVVVVVVATLYWQQSYSLYLCYVCTFLLECYLIEGGTIDKVRMFM